MHASRGSCHVSGAERLLDFAELEDAAAELLRRAMSHPRGPAERICLNLQPIATAHIRTAELLPILTHEVPNWQEGRAKAVELLTGHGLPEGLVRAAVNQLASGAAPDGGVMRGAMLVDDVSGERLEPDRQRGVRVSRLDIAPESRDAVARFLQRQKLDSPRVAEAWTLASKVALYPQIVAELCWSDDPGYVTGYVASAASGYQRITRLKAEGDMLGGRVFFVRRDAGEIALLIGGLQFDPVLFHLPSVRQK